jgi:broad specificity phosphatase PhoE
VSEVVRLTLVSHAMTDAMSAGRFPADEALNALGYRQVDATGDLGRVDLATCGPEKRCQQTAELLGLVADPDSRISDLDCGSWGGRGLDDVPADGLAAWLTDPTAAPHGGESVVGSFERVGGWLGSVAGVGGRVVAVTHPAVIRAVILLALDAPPKSFWRIDIAPASRTLLHYRGGAWTLRSTGWDPARLTPR